VENHKILLYRISFTNSYKTTDFRVEGHNLRFSANGDGIEMETILLAEYSTREIKKKRAKIVGIKTKIQEIL
jgi:hypothetical protein